MNKLVVLILSLFAYLHIAEAGSKSLTRSQNLSWAFEDSNTITFTYTISESEVEDYDYWGLGFQAVGTSGMRGDIITVSKSQGVLDTFATGNTMQMIDTTNNLSNTSLKLVDGKYVATWTRKLDTGDSKDLKLVKNTNYRLIWGFGKESSSGRWKEHDEGDYGVDSFQLEYTIDSDSDSTDTSNNGDNTDTSGSSGSGTTDSNDNTDTSNNGDNTDTSDNGSNTDTSNNGDNTDNTDPIQEQSGSSGTYKPDPNEDLTSAYNDNTFLRWVPGGKDLKSSSGFVPIIVNIIPLIALLLY